jgi:hypothetical protein
MFDDLLRCADGASTNLDRCENYSACDFFTQGAAIFYTKNVLAFDPISVDVVGATAFPFGPIFDNGINAVSVL